MGQAERRRRKYVNKNYSHCNAEGALMQSLHDWVGAACALRALLWISFDFRFCFLLFLSHLLRFELMPKFPV
jgi:hypothetical protein